MIEDTLKEPSARYGGLYALGAFGTWSFIPLYYKALEHVNPLEVLAHRIVWALIFSTGLLAVVGQLNRALHFLRQPRIVAWLTLSSILVAINWLAFIWAVFNDRVLEASLGYYINPLLNVVLGTVFLGERLRRFQLAAVFLAATGVVILIIGTSTPAWIALTLGTSFSCYGLVRKLASVDALVGMQIEGLILTPMALGYIYFRASHNELSFDDNAATALLLIVAGVLTALPLISFAEAAKRLTLSTLGFFQYVTPSMQFLLAVWVFDEHLSAAYIAAFAFIWSALALYSLETRHWRRSVVVARELGGQRSG